MDRLKSQIRNLRRENTCHRNFIPEVQFYDLMKRDAIREAVEASQVNAFQQDEITDCIATDGRKIYGILLLCGLATKISKFIEANTLHDAQLPFKLEVLEKDIGLTGTEAKDFDEFQLELSAPVFRRGTFNRRFGERTIVPFLHEDLIGKGAFGNVYKTSLDEEHQATGDVFPKHFARKEMDTEFYHQKELKNLAMLNYLNSPNIVELLGSYTVGTKHNLLFPLADTGDLATLLETERSQTEFTSDETFLVALAGLGLGIMQVHDFMQGQVDLELIGCHHDVRPQNILVSGTRFILADLGLATFKMQEQNSETPFKGGMGHYLAPECEDWENNFQRGLVHRTSDIWSFGGIIAEISVYMAFGKQAVKDFKEERRQKIRGVSLYQFHLGPNRASPVVDRWLSKLEVPSRGPSSMLARLARSMLAIEHSQRPSATSVSLRLRYFALYEISSTIHLLFRQLEETFNSLDATLEHMKFEAWRHAIGLLSNPNEAEWMTKTRVDTMPSFDETLNQLTRLRLDLRSRTQDQRKHPHISMSSLIALNDRLQELFSTEQKEKFQTYMKITVMQTDDDIIRQLADEEAAFPIDNGIRMCAIIKHMTLTVENGNSCQGSTRSLRLEDVTLKERFGAHRVGILTGNHVPLPAWIEWRTYTRHGANQDIIENLYKRVASMVEVLSQEKPETFRTMTCTGFFHDPGNGAFGIVFEIPRTLGAFQPISLRQVILDTWKNPKSWPDLGDKFKLASALASSILEFHTVGWVHKSLTASNVMFFPRLDERPVGAICNPFITGFNYSRPNDPKEFTEGASDSVEKNYQHPQYLTGQCGFEARFDYCSLGILLLEIGHWKPIVDLTAGYKGSFEDRRQRLLTSRIPGLRKYMGREYAEAVACCIRNEFPGHASANQLEVSTRDVLLAFKEQVVSRLSKCFA
ncbi:kinase-like protein [Hypoxylon sp. FL1857]|nr:kinase-like protein [Hypoxylon sp. FL1857]